MPFDDFRPHCPVCDSTRTYIDEHPAELWEFHVLDCCCLQCDATFEVVYRVVRVKEVRYGNPLGPVSLTDCPWQALAAWEVDEAQLIRTNGTQFAVGYEPLVFADGRGSQRGWEETSPEALETLCEQW
jgi:hypothetical protein